MLLLGQNDLDFFCSSNLIIRLNWIDTARLESEDLYNKFFFCMIIVVSLMNGRVGYLIWRLMSQYFFSFSVLLGIYSGFWANIFLFCGPEKVVLDDCWVGFIGPTKKLFFLFHSAKLEAKFSHYSTHSHTFTILLYIDWLHSSIQLTCDA